MTARRFASFALLVGGVAVILMGAPDGINGFTILGAILAVGGIDLAD
jgi:hypothetical protein